MSSQHETLLKIDLEPRHLLIVQQVLREFAPGIEVWAFGSRVKSGAHSGSDLDLVLRSLPNGVPGKLHQQLREKLAESALPILVDVHDWTKLPPEFQKEILACHVVVEIP